ncbi:MAG: DUF418 domain-containing protein [Fimbriimonadaceae bacterium]|nr:DUF418 domain-containing protein [Fimbriimonadaceae bacterium]
MQAVAPTVHGRIQALDFLRGIAILGILPANIAAFAEPSGPLFSTALPLSEPTSVEKWIEVVKLFLVTGKFRSMLAVLFGIGIWMQYEKRRSVPNAWPWGYLKRTGYLALLGLAHGLFLWYGDILWIYSGTAAVACFLATASERNLRRVIVAGAALALLASAGAFLGAVAMWSEGMRALPKTWSAGAMSPAAEVATFAAGSYSEQLAQRATVFAGSGGPAVVLMLPFLLPLFCLGVLWGRSGFLFKPGAHAMARGRVLLVGLGGGLALNALALALRPLPFNYFATLPWELFFGPILSLGYLVLGAMWVESGRLPGVVRAVSAVGRVALSAYLLQTVACTFVFYSWGLGMFGSVDRVEQMKIVLGVWGVDLVFAAVWLRFFNLGPIEWLWRSLTEGRRLPLLKSP